MTFIRHAGVACVVVLVLAAPAPAAAQEPFRNILSAGQGETVKAAELASYQATGGGGRRRARAVRHEPRRGATGCEDEPVCDQISYAAAGAVETAPIPRQDRPTAQQAVEIRRE